MEHARHLHSEKTTEPRRARLASVRPIAGDDDLHECEGHQRGQVVNLNRALSGLPEMSLRRTNYSGILDHMCGQGGRIEERRRTCDITAQTKCSSKNVRLLTKVGSRSCQYPYSFTVKTNASNQKLARAIRSPGR
jgi:hypothetical protein